MFYNIEKSLFPDYCADYVALIISFEFKNFMIRVEYLYNPPAESVTVCMQASAVILSYLFIALTFQQRLRASFLGFNVLFLNLVQHHRSHAFQTDILMLGYLIIVPPIKYFKTTQLT